MSDNSTKSASEIADMLEHGFNGIENVVPVLRRAIELLRAPSAPAVSGDSHVAANANTLTGLYKLPRYYWNRLMMGRVADDAPADYGYYRADEVQALAHKVHATSASVGADAKEGGAT